MNLVGSIARARDLIDKPARAKSPPAVARTLSAVRRAKKYGDPSALEQLAVDFVIFLGFDRRLEEGHKSAFPANGI